MNSSNVPSNSDVSLTYKFLLIFSTLAAVFFCWLYVTKPTQIVQAAASTSEAPQPHIETESLPNPTLQKEESHLVDAPSLPGLEKPSVIENATNEPTLTLPVSESTAQLIGYEETNDAIQHVIVAKSEEFNERIIIEVPVIYQTRGLRFSPSEANEAGRILRALKIYQAQLKKLHTDGKNIQKAWDQLLIKAQPVEALRADSPSLPQSQIEHASLLHENSATTIKVSE